MPIQNLYIGLVGTSPCCPDRVYKARVILLQGHGPMFEDYSSKKVIKLPALVTFCRQRAWGRSPGTCAFS
uniref:ATCOAD n=1 Tax=Arundo donax TaxID=35708 RepID=A0A0A9EH73_ARUDO